MHTFFLIIKHTNIRDDCRKTEGGQKKGDNKKEGKNTCRPYLPFSLSQKEKREKIKKREKNLEPVSAFLSFSEE